MVNIPGLEITPVFIWLCIIIVAIIVEAITMGLTTIWFAIGGIVAMLLGYMNASIPVQILAFIVISIVLLIYTRPIAVRWLKIGKERTNVDSLIGKTGIVTVAIEDLDAKGQVKVAGQIWSAKTINGESIDKDTVIKVIGIKGVKLIVQRNV